MQTYLLTWNPRTWKWETLREEIEAIQSGMPQLRQWSAGNTKKIRAGDRVFIFKQGQPPRGILMAGFASTDTIEQDHYNPGQAAAGRKALVIRALFNQTVPFVQGEALPFDIEGLSDDPIKSVNWSTPASGISIPTQAAQIIERSWSEFLAGNIVSTESNVLPSLADLRTAAYSAAADNPPSVQRLERNYYSRLQAVRLCVLARADGVCESCNEPAPFNRTDGMPYLEPHHIDRVADGGLDRPDKVAGICPNCHREIHHGLNGQLKNEKLREIVARKEANFCTSST